VGLTRMEAPVCDKGKGRRGGDNGKDDEQRWRSSGGNRVSREPRDGVHTE
jgi:hypothetical protein